MEKDLLNWGYNRHAAPKASKNSQFRQNASTNIINLLENETFRSRSKAGQRGAFTRDRKLSFTKLVVFLTQVGMKALQRELDGFYKKITGSEFNIREVTKGAFSQARSHLNPEAFLELNENVCKTFYDEAPYLMWKGHRLLAVDGTRLVLPKHKTIIEEFGEHGFGPDANSKRSIALGSMLYDVLNLLTLDARLMGFDFGERDLLYQHMSYLKEGDLLLLDRGYPSIAMFYMLKKEKVDFCVRMKENWWLKVKEFSESGRKEQIVQFNLPQKDINLFEGHEELIKKPVRCRLISVTLENGVKEILCTSLTDRKKYIYDDFEELYHLRWNEEEAYKLLKARAEIECFTGKTAIAVKQDFFAKIFAMTYCSLLAFPIEEKVRKEYTESKNKHPQKINRTNAFAMFREIGVALMLKGKIAKAIEAFDRNVFKTREIVRPGRSNERKKRPKRLHYMNYKNL